MKDQISRSPQRPQLTPTNAFPLECIFCENLELKLNRKLNDVYSSQCFVMSIRTIWKNIEDCAQYLVEYSLYGRIKNEDLFANGAHSHCTCRRLFNLRYYNAIRRCDQIASSSSMTEV